MHKYFQCIINIGIINKSYILIQLKIAGWMIYAVT